MLGRHGARAGSAAFAAQYGERLSAAAVIGDAPRCLRRLLALRQQAALAAQRAAKRRANAPVAPKRRSGRQLHCGVVPPLSGPPLASQ
eukprot:5846399-Prymnesium_polylepis.1